MRRFELKRHVSRRLTLGRRLGAAAATGEVTLSVLLHAKEDQALRDAVESVSDPTSDRYGRFLKPEEVRKLVAPGYQDLDAAIAWLHDAGLTTEEPTGARTVIRAHGTVEAASRALDAPFGLYSFPKGVDAHRREHFTIERNPSIPAALAPIVRGIAGLNDLPAARRFPALPSPARSRVPRKGPADSRGPAGGFSPDAVRAAYAVPPRGGAGQRAAILEFGGGFSADDLSTFCRQYGLPDGNVGEVSVSGGKNDYRGRTANTDLEVAMDVEWLHAVAPEAALDLYWVPNDDRGWVDFLAALLDAPSERRPGVVSISWGMPEDGFTTSRRYDQTRQLFQCCSLLGITFVAASGDAGAADEVPDGSAFDGQRHVDFPSMVPEVTGVGGTKLLPGPRGFTETAWNDGPDCGASGGGFSRFIRVSPWQTAAIGRRKGVTGRGVPDVAAVASPDPGLSILVHGRFTAAGGTSVAAPIWAGFLAQVNAARAASGKAPLGAANAALYGVAGSASPFRDVTEGGNSYAGVSGYSAGRGWDPVTGLGSADVSKLLKKLG